MTGRPLEFLAGHRALARIRDGGLAADDVEMVAGAAGGPKWLILGHLDRLLFGRWFKERQRPLHLIGSSIGSWRFAAASCSDPVAAIDRMEAAYIHQRYRPRPSPREVSATSLGIIESFLGEAGPGQILSHSTHRLGLLTVRSRHLLARETRLWLALGLGMAVAANLVDRRLLGVFFRQTLFQDPRTRPPVLADDRLPRDRCALTRTNVKSALLASGSIPWVMQAVPTIPGAPPGVYRDGGVVDYHLDLPFGLDGRGIVLYPHFSRRVIPGWFDKRLPWRVPDAGHMADLLLVAPASDFVSQLPGGKIADRSDFYRHAGDDDARFAAWQQVADAGRLLAEDFIEAVLSGNIRHRVRPLTSR